MKKLFIVFTLLSLAPFAAGADDRLVRFDGGIGVIPVQGLASDGTPVLNVVRGFFPGGAPWTISRLTADVRADGAIKVDGHGLVLAGGGSIGTAPGLQVRAVLLCGDPRTSTAHVSQETTLSPGGDFFIGGALNPSVLASCETPALLIVAGTRWLAAGILHQEDTGTRD